jgi:uncharacterized protein (DUF1778 family)
MRKCMLQLRISPHERELVRLYAQLSGKTMSQLIRERVVDKALQPLREAVAREGEVDTPEGQGDAA